MSEVAALTMAWSAAHLAIGLHNLSIHLRRPTDLEYLAFAVLSLGFAFFTTGAALVTNASTTAEGTTAMRVAFIGAPVALGGFVAFATLLLDKRGSRGLQLAIGWSALGLVASLAGLFVDPDQPALRSPYHEPQQTSLAVIWVGVACAFVAWTLYHVLRRSRSDRDLALLGWGALFLVAAALHDQAVHLLGVPGPYFFEHATLMTSLALSHMLLRRLAGTESELERRTDEFEVSYLELERAQDELIQKEQLAAVGELSAVIAHEIRNPLAILRNAAAGLRRGGLTASNEATLLSILDEEADRLGRLSQDLATYAQPLTPKADTIAIRELLSECVDAALGEARPLDITVDARTDGGPPIICGDPALLRRSLRGVIDNALQAMPTGGALVITTELGHVGPRNAVVIKVADTGEGMNSLVRGKALDPFFTTRASGTGLGLAIVDRVVRAHGGSVEIESRYGRGTTLSVTLPVAEPAP